MSSLTVRLEIHAESTDANILADLAVDKSGKTPLFKPLTYHAFSTVNFQIFCCWLNDAWEFFRIVISETRVQRYGGEMLIFRECFFVLKYKQC